MTDSLTTIGHPFSFSSKTREEAQKIMSHYPKGREKSALVPILDLAQRQAGGWLSREVLDYVAVFMNLPIIHIYEVASFYSMFNLKPVGTHFVQVCTTTPCWLRGSDQILSVCKKVLGEKAFEGVSADGHFSVKEVECLGACANAPMVQINDDYYEDLDEGSMTRILKDLQAGRDVKVGSQMGRVCSAPLEDLPLLDSKPPKPSPKPLLKSLKKED